MDLDIEPVTLRVGSSANIHGSAETLDPRGEAKVTRESSVLTLSVEAITDLRSAVHAFGNKLT